MCLYNSTVLKDGEGNPKYSVRIEAEELGEGNELFIYKIDKKTGKYVMVDAKTYEVNKSGSVTVSMKKKAVYELVNAGEAAKINREIKKSIIPRKANATVKKGKKTTFALSKKVDKENIKSITYVTSKKSVAQVNKKGKITAKKKGTVVVKAKVTLMNGTIH